MCIKCHQGLSDENIAEQLIDTGKYSGWNTTSISHISLSYLGMNGELAQSRASTLLNNYINWKRDNPTKGDGSLFGEPKVEYVEDMRSKMDELRTAFASDGITTSKQIKDAFYGQALV